MSLIVVGLNHRTVPVELLERVAISGPAVPKALHDLASREHLLEVAVLSTCNRTEIYALCTRFHPAVGDVREFLASYSGADPDEFADHLYTYFDDAAVTHLFSVAAGLDSMIVGEGEILGQVREAWQIALREGTAPQFLARAFKHAVESGKRVRTETGIGRHPVSIPSATIAVASEHLGSLEGARVLVIGAGDMGEGLARALAGRGAVDICIANRSQDRALDLATSVGGRAVPLYAIPDELVGADVVLASTSSSEVLIERSTVETAMSERGSRDLLIVDVALPRDFDPGVAEIEGVVFLDLDDLKDYAQRSAELRRREIGRAREILAHELHRYRAERAAREVAPLVSSLHSLGEETRRRELERFGARLAGLDPATRRSVEALTRGIVNKLLHEPTIRLKEHAGTDRGDLLAESLVALFALPEANEQPDSTEQRGTTETAPTPKPPENAG